ncbi:MAG: helix-turn-helix domain-containing protein [Pseudonocardiales bacterium]
MSVALPAQMTHDLDIGSAEEARVAVARAPHLSAILWLIDAASSRATHTRFESEVAKAAGPRSRPAWEALGIRGLDRIPNCLVPIEGGGETTVAECVTALRDSSGDELSAEVNALWGSQPPLPWRLAADRPRRWLAAFAEALSNVWSVTSSLWHANQNVVDHEIGRVGIAVVTGSVPELLNNLHTRLAYENGVLQLANTCERGSQLSTRKLVLAPLIVPTERVIVSFDHPQVAYIAYRALASHLSPLNPERVGSDRLSVMLGPVRAAALRGVARPRTMGELAQLLQCAPSTTTYHCDHLERAGLIVRERRHHCVWVSRTATADRLVELLAA